MRARRDSAQREDSAAAAPTMDPLIGVPFAQMMSCARICLFSARACGIWIGSVAYKNMHIRSSIHVYCTIGVFL